MCPTQKDCILPQSSVLPVGKSDEACEDMSETSWEEGHDREVMLETHESGCVDKLDILYGSKAMWQLVPGSFSPVAPDFVAG